MGSAQGTYCVCAWRGGGEILVPAKLLQGLLPATVRSVSRTNLGTGVEPQQIVAQRLLSCLQYPVPQQSRLQRI